VAAATTICDFFVELYGQTPQKEVTVHDTRHQWWIQGAKGRPTPPPYSSV